MRCKNKTKPENKTKQEQQKNPLVLTSQMKPGPKMGGPNKAFLLPHSAGSAPQLLCLCPKAKGTDVKLRGLLCERRWDPEAGCDVCRGRHPTNISAINLNLGWRGPRDWLG
uniref:Uncharacterized protein n=1 Tax=Mandrillus leucophaeus TaxID=9568 RepID=A0A2K5XE39_MANLE